MCLKDDYFLAEILSFTTISKDLLFYIFRYISLIFLLLLNFVMNSTLYYSLSNCLTAEFKEIPEDQYEKFLALTSNLSKQKLKNLKIQIIHNEKTDRKLIFYNMVYISIDFYLNFFKICLIFILVCDPDENVSTGKMLYILFIILGNSIKFFVMETKVQIEYFFAFFTSFLFSLRLLMISIFKYPLLYFVSNFNILILIIYYCLSPPKIFVITGAACCFLILCLNKINSYMLIADILVLIGTPIVKFLYKKRQNKNSNSNNIGDNKNGGSNNPNGGVSNNWSLLFLLPILVFFCLQLYGLQNYIDAMKNAFYYIKNKVLFFNFFDSEEERGRGNFREMNENSFGNEGKGISSGSKINNYEPIEYNLINALLNWMKN